ncbi:serine hydrolase domain-containing protein [Halolamina salifodinae]|uniref:CubicO group peptidase (Beta-lactamase class C family) n=1 Tax=Halolamina salifodinae TaxID=1202767 RepID=A0A8T4GYK6_9EURY|nr:serine hydrolase domain-containing protein [Halolamina salifodinae]MBP1986188.1 CubicO group peptidase (beta-lactamase class C family) [Halolamina salifodinae]
MPYSTRRGFLGACSAAAAGSVLADGATARPAETATEQESALGETVTDAVEQALPAADADGATVAVIEDGEPVTTEGFGHAYRNPEVTVDPEVTPLRIGSVSKAVTFVAAMALVDDGDVDPDSPVSTYLESVPVPDQDAYDEPITLAHLATHSAGFEQRYPGQVAVDAADIRPLPSALRANDPNRVAPPGERTMYTNYNAGLAGQLTADVLGTDFATAVDRLVFDPLGMDTSTFDPLPRALVGGDDDAAAAVNWFSEMPPASGISTTAADMARFLHALVGDGAAGDGRVLSAEAVADLHRQWYTPHERLAGASFGMERQRRDGTLVIGHGGGVPNFSADLRLIPETGAGLFVAAHGAEANEVQAAAREAFLDAAAPVSTVEPTTDGPPARVDELTGRYKSGLVTDTTSFEKALYGITRPATTVRVANGRLVTDDGNTTHRWIEVDPLVFRRQDGRDTLVFDPTDGETYIYRATEPRGALRSVPWYGQSRHHATFALVAGLVILSGAVGWPLGAGWRRFRGGESPDRSLTRARMAAGTSVAVLGLFALVGLFGVTNRWLYDPPPGFDLLFALPSLAALLSLTTLGLTARAWREGDWPRAARAHVTLVATGLVTLCGLCWYWNLLSVPW